MEVCKIKTIVQNHEEVVKATIKNVINSYKETDKMACLELDNLLGGLSKQEIEKVSSDLAKEGHIIKKNENGEYYLMIYGDLITVGG